MSIWDNEVIRVDGNLFAYVKVQNEYNGIYPEVLEEYIRIKMVSIITRPMAVIRSYTSLLNYFLPGRKEKRDL